MPYCVNCGSPVEKDDIVCNKCGKSPWRFSEGEKLGEKEPESRPDITTGLLSIIVLFAAIFLIFGLSTWQMGVFSAGRAPEYDEYLQAKGGGPTEILLGREYHIYRAFDFGDFGFFVNLMGIVMLLYVWVKIQKSLKSIRMLTIVISGTIFTVFALFIFIFGFNDLLTYTGGNVWFRPSFTQQYGWIIETVIFSSLGYALIVLTERLRRREDLSTSIYPIIMKPIAYVLILVTLIVYIFGLHNMIYSSDYTNYRQNMAWIIESLVFGLPAILLLMKADKIKEIEGIKKSSMPRALLPSALVLSIAFLIVYISGVNNTFFILGGEPDFRWFWESVFLGIPCALMLIKLDRIRVNEARKPVLPKILTPVSFLLSIAAVFSYVFGVHMSMYELLDDISLSWLVEVFLYALPSAVLFLAAKRIAGKEGFTAPVIHHFLKPIAAILLIATLLTYLIGVHSTFFYHSDKTDLKWTLEVLLFGIPLLSLLYLDERISGRKLWQYMLIPLSFILLLVAVFVYLSGVHISLYDTWRETDIMWLIEVVLFVAPAAVFLYYCGRIQKSWSKSITPYVVAPMYSILAFSTLLVYAFGAHSTLFYPWDDADLTWTLETFFFLVPAVAFLFLVERTVIGEQKKSVLPLALTPVIYILLLLSLITYVQGVHTSLKPYEEIDLLWIVELFLFIAPAAALTFVVDGIRKREGKKKSVTTTAAYVIGFILIIGTLMTFIFGLNNFLYQDTGNLNWLIETFCYLIPGGALIYLGDRLSKKMATSSVS
ncbi:MAG: zinc ribbon domain-containing protein [Candidatus Altiarchaeota archaeon]|nr:zinc ribbon domain-containing protein [Candidatus Altiarchaeota archaeon]